MVQKVFTADLHTHLLEKHTKPGDYWSVVKARKINVVAITEHAEFNPKKAFEELLGTKPRNVLLIPGIEINSAIGHVLVYGKDSNVYNFPGFFEKKVPIKKIIQISEKNSLLVSLAHPWGFSYDSAGFIAGKNKVEKIVSENKIGVEAFNGMLGQLGYFVYKSNWVKKPRGFFERLETNKIAKKIRLNKIGEKARKKIDEKTNEILERTAKAIELGNTASFVTAGSDAHSANRIGAGIMKMRLEEGIENKDFLDALRKKKNIEWIGPMIKEKKGRVEVVNIPRKKMEAVQAFKYAAKTVILKKAKAGKKLFKRIRKKNKK